MRRAQAEKNALTTSLPQIDTAVLDALPLAMRRELEAAYGGYRTAYRTVLYYTCLYCEPSQNIQGPARLCPVDL